MRQDYGDEDLPTLDPTGTLISAAAVASHSPNPLQLGGEQERFINTCGGGGGTEREGCSSGGHGGGGGGVTYIDVGFADLTDTLHPLSEEELQPPQQRRCHHHQRHPEEHDDAR